MKINGLWYTIVMLQQLHGRPLSFAFDIQSGFYFNPAMSTRHSMERHYPHVELPRTSTRNPVALQEVKLSSMKINASENIYIEGSQS